jgi:uncharacterized membrane protein YkoI
MKRSLVLFMFLGVVFLIAAVAEPLFAADTQKPVPAKDTAKVPPVVAKAVETNCPGAVVDKMEVEKEGGIALYDFEFKAGRGEIEVAEDGTVMDIATIVPLKDIPKAAADAILKAASGAKIAQLERSEVRAEIKTENGKGMIVRLAAPKFVFEAELVQGEKRGEVQVAPDGRIVEGPKWGADEEEKEEQVGENEEVEEDEEAEEAGEMKAAAGVDLKVLPPAVLTAFQKAYPKAVIKGASKEVEKGVTYYEVESVDGKMNRDLLYAADGKVVEVEEAVAPGALPAAVLKALDKAYPGYKIVKAEELTKDGQKLFELQIQVKGKTVGVTLDPTGKIVQ